MHRVSTAANSGLHPVKHLSVVKANARNGHMLAVPALVARIKTLSASAVRRFCDHAAIGLACLVCQSVAYVSFGCFGS
jgi:hypothetical protein